MQHCIIFFYKLSSKIILFCFMMVAVQFLFFFFLMAAPMAYGSSQARDWIRAAAMTFTTAAATLDP